MKSIKFSEMFLLSAWVIFIGTERSIAGSLLMMAAGAYEMAHVIPKLWKECRKNAKG